MILEVFANWVAEFSAILGVAVIVVSVVFTVFKVLTRNS